MNGMRLFQSRMMVGPMPSDIAAFLSQIRPYDSLDADQFARLIEGAELVETPKGETVYAHGGAVSALYVVKAGRIHITDPDGEMISIIGAQSSFGQRGLLRDGIAPFTATASEPTRLIAIPAAAFYSLRDENPAFKRFFERPSAAQSRRQDMTSMELGDLMTGNPATCSPQTSLIEAARLMRDRNISSVVVAKGGNLEGILTTRDLAKKALAEGLSYDAPVSQVMTRSPVTLPPTALVSDALHEMMERNIAYMPVSEAGKLVGILTQTDLTRFQALSSATIIQDITQATTSEELATIVHRIPQLLAQLVGAHHAHQTVTRLITDVGDATTRRLLKLGEDKFGPPPVPYLWLACGSQGRQEQTGVSDQDNCMIIDDAMKPEDDAYFKALSTFVTDGLDEAGYFYCPGEMMATTDRWRQPLRVWREYFQGWIRKPDPMAQMLASVMFDLRAIGGETELFSGLQKDILETAANNSIFVAHMVSNSLKHTPPLGLFRGFATERSGEHKNTIDLKHNGVVPVVDLGRIYALQGEITQVNTYARLTAAIQEGVVSSSGGRDLIDAYDVIAETRLIHQAAQIRRGEKPDNFMIPTELSEFERSHLRDAFVVIKTMQSAAAASRGGFMT